MTRFLHVLTTPVSPIDHQRSISRPSIPHPNQPATVPPTQPVITPAQLPFLLRNSSKRLRNLSLRPRSHIFARTVSHYHRATHRFRAQLVISTPQAVITARACHYARRSSSNSPRSQSKQLRNHKVRFPRPRTNLALQHLSRRNSSFLSKKRKHLSQSKPREVPEK
jgi:hypothetical protein